MVKNKELLEELEEKFKKLKDDLKFETTLEEIDSIFFIKDCILGAGFVSPSLSRQICSRIVDTYSSWISHLHNLILPNPQSIIDLNESKAFNEEERKEILQVINKGMALISANPLAGLTKDKQLESQFIEDSVKLWKDFFNPKLTKISRKINNGWKNA